ncbi:putative signal transduction histidine kinase [Allomuricauda ruestringensis DSM 13258]|uniref:Signal transduction histidine kinase n=1 Tax=Allomuricauda ruestringensis (strain DSM 13258 / CIP 107369 / LMG 19739 / B1) TaxID=886377 RepID=G2PRW0_ALLRU|nr:histidine kinase [Allomuricauda ruestringensis]AEM69755.1 putative signal transduction histidine kinase [Allomuricauda ruestringensis DSM 13258]
MELSTRKRNIVFWVLQFLGWGFINSIAILIPQGISFEMTIFSVIVGIFIGVFSTSILRWYLKRNVHFDSFGGKEVIKIIVSTLVASTIFGLLNVFFGYIYIKFGPELTETELHMFEGYDKIMVQVLNSVFLVGAWTITYLVIKLLLKLNQNRIERLELNTTLKQAQLNTLKGQINPHFMFNSLNNIRGLMLEDVDRSREMLTKLSEILRYSLTKNNINDIPVHEELEVVDNYIDLSKIQFEDRLEFVKQVDDDTFDVRIPPMIIQLLIENAVKHGISNLKNGGRILLAITKKDGKLLIEVRNTGKLEISKDSTQLGLKNIEQRLKLLYTDRASFKLEEISDEVVAQIKIPLV